jgi:hypothetical protein
MADFGRGLEAVGRTDLLGTIGSVSSFIEKAKSAEEARKLREELESTRVPIGGAPAPAATPIEAPAGGAGAGIDIGTGAGIGMGAEESPTTQALGAIQAEEAEQVVDVQDVPAIQALAPFPSAQNLLMKVADVNGWIQNVGGVQTISARNLQTAQALISQDLNLQKNLNELALNDIVGTEGQITNALADPKLKDDERQQLAEQLEQVKIQKGSILNAVNAMDREIRKAQALATPAGEKPLTLTNVQAAVVDKARTVGREGLTPAEQQVFDKVVAVSKGQTISVGAGETELEKGVGKLNVKTLEGFREEGKNARDTTLNLKKVEALLPRVKTGKFKGVKTAAASAAKAFGIDLDPELDDTQSLAALTSELALRLRNPESGLGLTGNTSEKDLQFLKDAVIGIEKEPAANEVLLFMALKAQKRRVEIAKMAEKHFREFRKAGKALDAFGPEWQNELDTFADKNPLFTDKEVSDILGKVKTPAGEAPLEPTGGAQRIGRFQVEVLP